jgi:hypothetical protein
MPHNLEERFDARIYKRTDSASAIAAAKRFYDKRFRGPIERDPLSNKRFLAYPDFHDHSLFQNLKQIAVVIGPQFYRRAVACHPVGMVPDRRDLQQGRIARQ